MSDSYDVYLYDKELGSKKMEEAVSKEKAIESVLYFKADGMNSYYTERELQEA